MKPEIKKALFFIFIIIAYSLQAIVRSFAFPYIYILSFIASVLCIYIIKNKYFSFFVGIAILLATFFYDADYICLTSIAFVLICAHKSLVSESKSDKIAKKHTDSFSFLSVQLSLLLSIALVIYGITLIISSESRNSVISSNRILLIALWLVGISIYSLSADRMNKKYLPKINKQLSGSLCFMYIVSVIGFTATVLFTFADYNSRVEIPHEVVLLPWFVFICSMIYNGDPYITSIEKHAEDLLTKISNKSKVK